MNAVVEAPVRVVEVFANLRFPPGLDVRLRHLMDRNNEGLLEGGERIELESLVEVSESMSLARAHALHLLGRMPA